jgi:hypothetical protein
MTDSYMHSTNNHAGVRDERTWVRWAMPSAADLIFVAIMSVLWLTPLSVKLLGDAGIGWHIRTGQQIVAMHAIPRVDSFSVTAHGQPWFAWEWLYDVVVGWLESLAGLNGVVWFTAVMIAATFAWLFRLLVAQGTDFPIALGLTLVATVAAMIHFLARPHVVSWLFTLAWFWILVSEERGRFDAHGFDDQSKRLWALPFLMIVWVNVHGGFLVGFVLLGIFWLGAVWVWWRTKEGRIEDVLQRLAAGRQIKDLSLVGFVCVVASFVNPYGWKLHAHIYSYLTNRFLMDHIEEFQSPNFHGISQKCFGALILIAIAALGMPTLRRKERDVRVGQPQTLLTILFAVYAGLYASRNIPVSAILLAMVVGPMLGDLSLARGFSRRMGGVEAGLRGHLWPGIGIVIAFLVAMNGGRVGSSRLMDAHFDPARMPVGAVEYLEKQRLGGPVFCPDYWGGYLIFRFYPVARVVADDRHDLYGDGFFKSYLKMWRVEKGWNGFLEAHPVRLLVLPLDAALTNLLIGDSEWKEVYRDDTAVVFENQSRAN